MKNLIFIYGTLLDENFLSALIGRKAKIFKDSVDDYEISSVKDDDGKYYPNILQKENRRVVGGVIEVTKDELDLIDKYEGKNYRRKLITTSTGVSARIYIS